MKRFRHCQNLLRRRARSIRAALQLLGTIGTQVYEGSICMKVMPVEELLIFQRDCSISTSSSSTNRIEKDGSN